MNALRPLWREPMLHFMLLGLALFVWYGYVAPSDADASRIVVTQAQVDAMSRQFEATWNRAPTAKELHSLVDAWIRDELLYRAGRELGLDRDDAVIRRRVLQKYEVMSEELVAMEPPTDAELSKFLQQNPQRFSLPGTVTFEQVLVGDVGVDAAEPAARARASLARGASAAEVSMRSMLPVREDATPLDLVARDFGQRFADELVQAPLGQWHGPVESAFGQHLVRVAQRTAPTTPALDEARVAVTREWESDRRQRALAANLDELRRRFSVVVEAALPSDSSS